MIIIADNISPTSAEQGQLGDSIGLEIGFRWAPSAGAFPADAEVDFSISAPRDAARRLRDRLQPRMDRQGNFLHLSLSGVDPERIASVLNAVLERHVLLAASSGAGLGLDPASL